MTVAGTNDAGKPMVELVKRMMPGTWTPLLASIGISSTAGRTGGHGYALLLITIDTKYGFNNSEALTGLNHKFNLIV